MTRALIPAFLVAAGVVLALVGIAADDSTRVFAGLASLGVGLVGLYLA